MDEKELMDLVEAWDSSEYEKTLESGPPNDPTSQEDIKTLENRHSFMLDDTRFLSEHFFNDYELNRNIPFMSILCKWLSQFIGIISNQELPDQTDINDFKSLDSDSRYAFILARKILFFNRDQIISLIDEVLNKIKMELFTLASIQHNRSIVDLIWDREFFDEQLHFSLFVPLSDSSRFMEFRHVLTQNHNLILPCIDRLLMPVDFGSKEYIQKIKKNYEDKRYLFIVEDFTGSGSTANHIIEKIINNYHFEKIYFCPFILNHKAEQKLKESENIASTAGKEFKVIYGMKLDETYSISEDKGSYWADEEREALKAISRKYFKKYFKDNKYIRHYGFRNTGLSVVLHSNCPNNSLPVIWENINNWSPLFYRHERYRYRRSK